MKETGYLRKQESWLGGRKWPDWELYSSPFARLLVLLLAASLFACDSSPSMNAEVPIDKLFTQLPASYTGVHFENNVEYTEEFNVYTYRNFYNGGGVGLGDIDNDGLLDLYFCGNQQPNRLYRNQGTGFQFEDITDRAGVSSEGVWSTGVSVADVNGDGWLDIYVCKSGAIEGEKRHNELFINNHDLTFTERAAEYGLAEKGLSTHAAFFDYDRDGDLDCYLLNNSFRSVGNYDLVKDQRKVRDPLGGNKLYRNDPRPDGTPFFTDVSESAGIYGSTIGFGLGVTIGDVNRDGWPDIYVSNDFFERDYLYINQRDGSFQESLEDYIREISMGSMGADMADLNNDAYPEIFVTDMLPETNERIKTKTMFENWNKYQLNVKNGYYHQFTRNVLQLNNGPVPEAVSEPAGKKNTAVSFSEIGRLAGVQATDWSWGALMQDFDNDGQKDIFVANGIFKDLMDLDYIQFMADPATVREILKKEKSVIKKLVDRMPSQKLSNYLFHNKGNLTFANVSDSWGLGTPSFSNGSAYGDIDNDGDLDLVVSNVNMPPFLYRNESDTLLKKNRFLQIHLKGIGRNPFAVGAQVTVMHQGARYYQELNPMRGFESSVGYGLHFGLGELMKVDSVLIQWPNGEASILRDVATNRMLTLHQQEMPKIQVPEPSVPAAPPVFRELSAEAGLSYVHQENDFVDFDRDGLIYQMLSAEGPRLCKGDVNGDGRDDVFIGGAKDSPGALFVQTKNGQFIRTNEALFEQDKVSEDTDCLFFDADNDGDQDLYVCSGGNEFPTASTALIDRLYFNDGKGNLTKSPQILPAGEFESSACVKAADFDGDGDQDLFVGIRLKPFQYGLPGNGYLLQNDGKGHFKNVTQAWAPDLLNLGLIKDATWADYDGDQLPDLMVVGEWMGIKVFHNERSSDGRQRQLVDVSERAGLGQTNGFWNCLQAGDFDHDGDLDFVLGNQGLNSRLKASSTQPLAMYVSDFDHNGSVEQVLCAYNGGKSYPLAARQDLITQVPELKKKYLKNVSFQDQTITDIFRPSQLHKALSLYAYECRTSLLINQGNGTFQLKPLPGAAQFTSVYGLSVEDFNHDGNPDILLGGNFYRCKPELGMYDASYGLLMTGNGKGDFKAMSAVASGFFSKGEIRDFITIKRGKDRLLLTGKNNEKIQVFGY
jgi:enediyne biosynthesis protein E4